MATKQENKQADVETVQNAKTETAENQRPFDMVVPKGMAHDVKGQDKASRISLGGNESIYVAKAQTVEFKSEKGADLVGVRLPKETTVVSAQRGDDGKVTYERTPMAKEDVVAKFQANQETYQAAKAESAKTVDKAAEASERVASTDEASKSGPEY